jgi:hypothetical protein
MDIFDVWQTRFEAVDRAIMRSSTTWAINYWTLVRRQLLRKMHRDLGKRYL